MIETQQSAQNQVNTPESAKQQAPESQKREKAQKKPVKYKHSQKMTWWKRWWRGWCVLRLLLWTIWVIYRERKRIIRAREQGDYEVQPNSDILIEVLVQFRQTAIQLGVLMIKLGQFLSTRADLLPEKALAVLTSLQDEVPPEPFDHVVTVIESELKQPIENIFSSLEEQCTAAASLGQVHKAVLKSTGETVAVKIQRPNIDQLVRMDLGTLKFVIWLITKFVNTGDFVDLWGMYSEFRRTVFEEINFSNEAAHARRFREIFQHQPDIYIPRIIDTYVTRRLLVMEWIDGIKINDYQSLDTLKVNRLAVARKTVNAYFYQLFEVGFYHADPHPGNIFVKRGSDPANPIIAFLDFGMVGTITPQIRRLLRELFLSLITRDTHLLVNTLLRLGFIGKGANIAAIEEALSLLLDQYYGMTLGQFRDMDMSDIAQDVVSLLYSQPFRIPAQFAFSGRAVSTLVGVATGLAPDFNFVEEAKPYARHFLGLDAQNMTNTLRDLSRQLFDTGRIMMTLPRRVERLITGIETGQIEIQIANLTSGTRGQKRLSLASALIGRGGSFSLLIVFLSSLGGGIYLTNIHQMLTGWFCLGLSALVALGLLLKR